jgi:hypothetical protein
MSKYVSGILLIVIGIIFLFANTGWLSADFFWSLLQLWPIIFVVIGINFMTRGTTLRGLGSLLFLIALISVVSLAVASHVYLQDGQTWNAGPITVTKDNISINNWTLNNSQNNKQTSQYESDVPSSAKTYSAEIKFGAGNLTIDSVSDKLISADFSSPSSAAADVTIDEGTNTEITIASPAKSGWIFGSQPNQTWQIHLNDKLPSSLDVKTGASSNHLDLSNLNLQDLKLDVGAAETTVKYGIKNSSVTSSINIGAASLTLQIPDSMGVALTYEGGVSSISLPSDIKKTGGSHYKSTDFDSSSSKLTITIKAGVSSINIERYTPSATTSTSMTDEISFDRLRDGAHSPYVYDGTDPKVIVMNSSTIKQKTSQLVPIYDTTLNQDKLVLLLLQGNKSTGGYRIRTTSVTTDQDTLTIMAEITEPRRADLVTNSLTDPYDLISIDKTDLILSATLNIILVDQDGKILDQTTYEETAK